MGKYVLRRLLALPVIILLVTFILFFITLQIPVEQRVQIYVPSTNPHLEPEEYDALIQEIIERRGLDRPVIVQYVDWLADLFSGQWGYSPTWRQPVLEGVRQRLPATLELTLFALSPSVILALSLGGLAAKFQNRLPDYLIRGIAFVGWAFPSFILGLWLMNVLYAWQHWFPPERLSPWASPIVNSQDFRTFTGMYTIDGLLNGEMRIFFDALRHLVLPGLTLAAMQWALLTRVMRDSMLEALQKDYITTARSKGLHERQVVNLHARRNAILPLISTTGVTVSTMLSTIVVVEVLFNFNGIGRWAVRGILQFDVPVAIGFAVLSCTITILASLTADILYAVIDPRVRLD